MLRVILALLVSFLVISTVIAFPTDDQYQEIYNCFNFVLLEPGTNFPTCNATCDEAKNYERVDFGWKYCVPKVEQSSPTKQSVNFTVHQECVVDVGDLCGEVFSQADLNPHFYKVVWIVAAFLGVVPKVDFEPQFLYWSDKNSEYELEFFRLVQNRLLGGVLPYAPTDTEGPYHFYVAIRIESERIQLPIDLTLLSARLKFADTKILDFQSGVSLPNNVGSSSSFSPEFQFQSYPKNWNVFYEPPEPLACPYGDKVSPFFGTWVGLCHEDADFFDCATVRSDSRRDIFEVKCVKCVDENICLAEHTINNRTTFNGKYLVTHVGARIDDDLGILRYEGENVNFPFIDWEPTDCRWCPLEAYVEPIIVEPTPECTSNTQCGANEICNSANECEAVVIITPTPIYTPAPEPSTTTLSPDFVPDNERTGMDPIPLILIGVGVLVFLAGVGGLVRRSAEKKIRARNRAAVEEATEDEFFSDDRNIPTGAPPTKIGNSKNNNSNNKAKSKQRDAELYEQYRNSMNSRNYQNEYPTHSSNFNNNIGKAAKERANPVHSEVPRAKAAVKKNRNKSAYERRSFRAEDYEIPDPPEFPNSNSSNSGGSNYFQKPKGRADFKPPKGPSAYQNDRNKQNFDREKEEPSRPRSAEPRPPVSDSRPKWEIDLDKDLNTFVKKSLAERKKHYKELLLKYHPDKNKTDSAEVANAIMRYLLSRKQWFLEP